MTMEYDENGWYAIRVTYCRELKLKAYLEERDITCFLPMHYEIQNKAGKKIKRIVPVIHNLIFIYSTRKTLDQIKPRVESIAAMRYIMDGSTNAPIVVSEREMLNFIAISKTMDEQLQYVCSADMNLKTNDTVLITEGIFSGVTGLVIGTKRKCRVIVSIPGLMTVATAHIDQSVLRKIAQ